MINVKSSLFHRALGITELWCSCLEIEDLVMLKRIDQATRAVLKATFENALTRIKIFQYKMMRLEEEGRLFEYVHQYSQKPLPPPFSIGDILAAVSSEQLQELWVESLKIHSPLTEIILTSNCCPPVTEELVLLETISEDFAWTVYRNNPIAAQAILASPYADEISPADLNSGLSAARLIPNVSIVEAILTSPYAGKISVHEWTQSLVWAVHMSNSDLFQIILSHCETHSQIKAIVDLILEEKIFSKLLVEPDHALSSLNLKFNIIQKILSSPYADKILGGALSKSVVNDFQWIELYKEIPRLSCDAANSVLAILTSPYVQKIPSEIISELFIKASSSIAQSSCPEIATLYSNIVKTILDSKYSKLSDQDLQTAWENTLQSQNVEMILAFYSSKRAVIAIKNLFSSLKDIKIKQLIQSLLLALWRMHFSLAKTLSSEVFHRLTTAIKLSFSRA